MPFIFTFTVLSSDWQITDWAIQFSHIGLYGLKFWFLPVIWRPSPSLFNGKIINAGDCNKTVLSSFLAVNSPLRLSTINTPLFNKISIISAFSCQKSFPAWIISCFSGTFNCFGKIWKLYSSITKPRTPVMVNSNISILRKDSGNWILKSPSERGATSTTTLPLLLPAFHSIIHSDKLLKLWRFSTWKQIMPSVDIFPFCSILTGLKAFFIPQYSGFSRRHPSTGPQVP